MSVEKGATSSSLTDIMASLVAVFVLLFVAAQNNRGAGIKSARDELIKQLQGELVKAGIEKSAVDSVPNDISTVVVVLPDSVLFERGSSVMRESGRRVVNKATPLLTSVLCGTITRRKVDQLVVEGHTDNTIPDGMTAENGRRYNLALSQRRSMDFVQVSTQSLQGQERPLECYLNLVSATGRGQEEPLPGIAPDSSPQRRVVLRIRLRTDAKDTTRVVPSTIRDGNATAR